MSQSSKLFLKFMKTVAVSPPQEVFFPAGPTFWQHRLFDIPLSAISEH